MINEVMLIGRATDEPVIKGSADKKVLSVGMAINKGSGEKKRTDYPRIVAFGRTADFMEENLYKGARFAVVGRLQTGSYTKEDGSKAYSTDVVVDKFEAIDSKKWAANGTAKAQPQEAQAPQQAPQAAQQAPPQQASMDEIAAMADFIADEDLNI